MADPPPPYSMSDDRDGDQDVQHHTDVTFESRYVGYFRLSSQPVRGLVPSLTGPYTHQHHAVVTIVNTVNRSLSTFHVLSSGSFPCEQAPVYTSFTREISLESMRMISGFETLNELIVRATNGSSGADMNEEDVRKLHDHLSRQPLGAATGDQPQQDATIMHRVRKDASNDSSVEAASITLTRDDIGDAMEVHAYRIHIFTSEPDVSLHHTEESSALLFKWAKLHPTYGDLHGRWNVSLPDVIDDGAFRGGRDLKLLVRRVSQQQLQELEEQSTDVIHEC